MKISKAWGLVVVALLLCVALVAVHGITLTVNIAQNRYPIDPLVYGVNQLTSCDPAVYGCTQFLEISARSFQYPINRLGGNSVTSYAYDINSGGSGLDWYFITAGSITRAGYNTSLDQFINETLKQMHAQPLIQISMIGYTPSTTTKCWGSSITKYGAQDASEPYQSDAGNGKRGGTLLSQLSTPVYLNPTDCSRKVGPSYVQSEVQYIVNHYGPSASGGVKFYQLDNEMALWDSTHMDFHPLPVTLDEMWSLMVNYSKAIRAAEPNALILSPPAWGYCEYLYSALDGCHPGADYISHGNTTLLLYLAKQNVNYYQTNGFKVFDYLDVHIYPQSGEYSSNEQPSMQQIRLQTVRDLYEIGYHDPSWIGDPNQINASIYMIPRLRQILSAVGNPSWLKIAISEYNWGGDTGISSGIAQAEILAIFGRERLDLATRWVAPAQGTCVENAFKLYLDYDGAGSTVTGDTVSCQNDQINSTYLTNYAIYNSNTGKLFVLVFNKDPAIVSKTITISTGSLNIQGNVDVYSFDNAGNCNLTKGSSIIPSSNAFGATVTGYSSTMFVVPVPQVMSTQSNTPSSRPSNTPSFSFGASQSPSSTFGTSPSPTSVPSQSQSSEPQGDGFGDGGAQARLSSWMDLL